MKQKKEMAVNQADANAYSGMISDIDSQLLMLQEKRHLLRVRRSIAAVQGMPEVGRVTIQFTKTTDTDPSAAGVPRSVLYPEPLMLGGDICQKIAELVEMFLATNPT